MPAHRISMPKLRELLGISSDPTVAPGIGQVLFGGRGSKDRSFLGSSEVANADTWRKGRDIIVKTDALSILAQQAVEHHSMSNWKISSRDDDTQEVYIRSDYAPVFFEQGQPSQQSEYYTVSCRLDPTFFEKLGSSNNTQPDNDEKERVLVSTGVRLKAVPSENPNVLGDNSVQPVTGDIIVEMTTGNGWLEVTRHPKYQDYVAAKSGGFTQNVVSVADKITFALTSMEYMRDYRDVRKDSSLKDGNSDVIYLKKPTEYPSGQFSMRVQVYTPVGNPNSTY